MTLNNMKKITQNQIQLILDEMLKLNIPVQSYAGLQKMFNEMPEIKEEK